jgi:glutamate-1-semialdehyde 2,1-aminomutase
VLRLEGHFHGWADELAEPGTVGTVSNYVKIIPANDIDVVEAELATREYAILLTEGGGGNMGRQNPLDNEFTKALRDLTHKFGTVWLIDEVITGFREAPGGWQSLVGVTPDLTSLGKCVGGGLGSGALVGRAEIFTPLSPSAPSERRILHSGTWNSNPLTASAGLAACKLYQSGEVQKKTSRLAAQFRQKGNQLFKELKINARLYSRSIVHLYLGSIEYEPEDDTMPPTEDFTKILDSAMNPGRARLSLFLLQSGIATSIAKYFAFCIAHTESDIDQTVKALADSIEATTKEGSLSRHKI